MTLDNCTISTDKHSKMKHIIILLCLTSVNCIVGQNIIWHIDTSKASNDTDSAVFINLDIHAINLSGEHISVLRPSISNVLGYSWGYFEILETTSGMVFTTVFEEQLGSARPAIFDAKVKWTEFIGHDSIAPQSNISFKVKLSIGERGVAGTKSYSSYRLIDSEFKQFLLFQPGKRYLIRYCQNPEMLDSEILEFYKETNGVLGEICSCWSEIRN